MKHIWWSGLFLFSCGENNNPLCGDSVIDFGEVCDDGNNIDGDGCSATCARAELCGDGVLDPQEVCDDGNTNGGDGCAFDCSRLESCGDTLIQAELGEECDDGNTNNGDGCSALCARERCGNGTIDADEECDDGNQQNGDACNADCTNSTCGDNTAQPGELCFGAPTAVLSGVGAFQLSEGDFDLDGDLDLVVADVGASQTLVLQNEAGVFTNIQSLANGVDTPLTVLLVDLNADGRKELALSKTNFGTNNSTLEVFSFDGASFVIQSSLFRGGIASFSLISGNFNGDALPDVAVANVNGGSVTTIQNNGNNQFSVLANLGGFQQPNAIAAGDFNADGFDDIAVADLTATTSQVLLSNGSSQLFRQSVFLSGFGGLGAAAGDTNQDGVEDYLIAHALFGTSLLYQGNPGALPSKVGSVFAQSARSLTLSDLDGDGDLDLLSANGGDVFQNQGLFSSPITNIVSVFVNEGGIFRAIDSIEVGQGPSAVVAGDFTEDGIIDLISTDVVGAQLTLTPGVR
jgi:cysteine-rich repeat protein